MKLFDQPEDIGRLESDCWKHLASAMDDRTADWRLAVLGTTAMQLSRQRTVVIRKINIDRRELFIHTDVRSAKIGEIAVSPIVSWLFYDRSRKVQFLISGEAVVHKDDAVASALWDSEPDSSLRCYLGPYAPGTVLSSADANLPAAVIDEIPDRETLNAGRKNFAVVSCIAANTECVVLRRQGNVRAAFTYSEGKVTREWLAP